MKDSYQKISSDFVKLVEKCPVTADTDWIAERNYLLIRYKNLSRLDHKDRGHLRGGGRTTRMLTEARELALSGKAVYVLGANEQDRFHLLDSFSKMFGPMEANKLGIKFESYLENFCWDTFILRGAHPNCVVLVDHFAIESRFRKALEMLHRYDSDSENK